MTYVDSSVVLAQLFAEDRVPPVSFWQQSLVSSRLTEYEVWVRVRARGLATSHGDTARAILARMALVELSPLALARTLEPFPLEVRTLDALHLSTVDYLTTIDARLELATYDERMTRAAENLGFALAAV